MKPMDHTFDLWKQDTTGTWIPLLVPVDLVGTQTAVINAVKPFIPTDGAVQLMRIGPASRERVALWVNGRPCAVNALP